MDADLGELLNLEPKSAARLRAAGVSDVQSLRRLGPVAAFQRVELAGFKPSLNLLYALAGALEATR